MTNYMSLPEGLFRGTFCGNFPTQRGLPYARFDLIGYGHVLIPCMFARGCAFLRRGESVSIQLGPVHVRTAQAPGLRGQTFRSRFVELRSIR